MPKFYNWKNINFLYSQFMSGHHKPNYGQTKSTNKTLNKYLPRSYWKLYGNWNAIFIINLLAYYMASKITTQCIQFDLFISVLVLTMIMFLANKLFYCELSNNVLRKKKCWNFDVNEDVLWKIKYAWMRITTQF